MFISESTLDRLPKEQQGDEGGELEEVKLENIGRVRGIRSIV